MSTAAHLRPPRPRMAPKRQRLLLLLAALVALGAATALALSALGDKVTYFYAPSDIVDSGRAPPAGAVRLGGLVQPGSVRRLGDGLTLAFTVTDNRRAIPVTYRGIVPDLFREGQGVIAEGRFDRGGRFVADTLLAKHDENYMPPEVAGSLHRTATVEP